MPKRERSAGTDGGGDRLVLQYCVYTGRTRCSEFKSGGGESEKPDKQNKQKKGLANDPLSKKKK